MSIEILEAKAELKDLVDTFSNLADVKDAKSQGELFLPDGWLEFQMGLDGEINKIEGREALVQAFAATINPCKAVYHINGQHTVTVNGRILYCGAQYGGERDETFDAWYLAPGTETATYRIPSEILENGCADIVIGEPTEGVKLSEFWILRA